MKKTLLVVYVVVWQLFVFAPMQAQERRWTFKPGMKHDGKSSMTAHFLYTTKDKVAVLKILSSSKARTYSIPSKYLSAQSLALVKKLKSQKTPTWTFSSGRKELTAHFISASKDKVLLYSKKKFHHYKLSQLSPQSRALATKLKAEGAGSVGQKPIVSKPAASKVIEIPSGKALKDLLAKALTIPSSRIVELNKKNDSGKLFYAPKAKTPYTGWVKSLTGGKPYALIKFKNGVYDGPKFRWWPKSPHGKMSVTNYKNGKRHGTSSLWYPNGDKWEVARYENGKQVGSYTRWHLVGGQKELQGQFKNGKVDGVWMFYDESGRIVAREIHKNGQRIK